VGVLNDALQKVEKGKIEGIQRQYICFVEGAHTSLLKKK